MLREEDFMTLEDLGSGNGGQVVKAKHKPTDLIVAKKVGVSIKGRVHQVIMFPNMVLSTFAVNLSGCEANCENSNYARVDNLARVHISLHCWLLQQLQPQQRDLHGDGAYGWSCLGKYTIIN